MIILFLVLFIGLIICDIRWWDTDAFAVIGIIGFVISALAAVLLGVGLSEGRVIDERITLYEETNRQIDESIYEMVAQYQNYEGETFEKLKGATADTLVSLYPELKTDTLVNSQMEIYVNNRKEILALKERKIKLKVARWWLYFGK